MNRYAWLLGLLLFGSALAQGSLPPIRESGGVRYLSGGIGSDEAAAIEAVAPQWPLMLEFAVQSEPRAEHAADVSVEIADNEGNTVLMITAGPYLLLRVPPGRYVVRATRAGETKTQQLVVRKRGQARALFLWPAAG